MKLGGRLIAHLFLVVLALGLWGCGASPWRYDPGVAAVPSNLVATAGNGVALLSWTQQQNVSSYDIYYATSPGVTSASGTKITVQGSSKLVSGLSNGTSYYFRIVANNSNGPSPLSAEVTATPSQAGIFLQSDLEGTWRFNALACGSDAGWMRGSITIDPSGAVSIVSYLDSSGGSVAPAGLFSTMSIQPDGSVAQDGAAAGFHGVLSAGLYRDLLVGTGSSGSSRTLVVLQKVVPGISFSATDIQGTGQAGAGPLPMVYHQISSGAVSEWEWGSFQVGRDQSETYVTIGALNPKALPGAGAKVAGLTISADGLVSETPKNGIVPQPAALLSGAVMSADKMTIVGTATDSRGAFLLRVIQLVHPPATALTASSYLLSGLAGSYGYRDLASGASPATSLATLTIAASGAAALSGYLDSNGGSSPPAPFTLAVDSQGLLTAAGDASYHGQLSYFNDLLVATRTDAAGAPALSLALRRGN
jgi:hypothetical protein